MDFNQAQHILATYGIELSSIEFEVNKTKKVIVGMSGGVDSSVSAVILKLMGFEVIGMFMKNWQEEINGQCPAERDYKDVVSVCETLDIPYYSIDFSEEYFKNVFEVFLKELKLGQTPNPDILCNREIKFKVFYDHAMKLGADYLATGHYCKKIENNGNVYLAKGEDQNKDQTYFLYTMKSSILRNVLFPVGNLQKKIVRKIASDYNLITSAKKDSTGICFIGERDFKEFMKNYIQSTKGNFVDQNGKVLGPHDGHPFYTIGQRKGLGVGGPGGPWFVAGKNPTKNEILLVSGENNPRLFAKELWASDISFVNNLDIVLPYRCKAKIRYRQSDQDCQIVSVDNGIFHVVFDKPQRAITEKQSIVFYENEICLGGAIIDKVGAPLDESDFNFQNVQNNLLESELSLQ